MMTLAKGKAETGKITSDQQQLVSYTIAGIKARTTAQGKKMTKVEAYERAWDLGMKGDFSLVDLFIQIINPLI